MPRETPLFLNMIDSAYPAIDASPELLTTEVGRMTLANRAAIRDMIRTYRGHLERQAKR